MLNDLTGLGYGIVTFGILIGVGTLILFHFGGAVSICATGFAWNSTASTCTNTTGGAETSTPTGQAYTNTNYLLGQLGSNGLSGWVPAIIAVSVGLLFLGAFLIGKGKKGRY